MEMGRGEERVRCMERVTRKFNITVCKIDSKQEFVVWLRKLKQRLCVNLEWWDGEGDGREVQERGAYVHLWLIHIEVLQKTTKFCKAIIFQ